MEHEVHRAVLITGASSGIGLELARVFARNGHNLMLVARDEQRLSLVAEEMEVKYGVTCGMIAFDLSSPTSAEDLYRMMQAKEIIVDILVNNAGFGTWGKFWEIDAEKESREMQLNMVSLALLTKYFVADMVQRGTGNVLNVASTAAYQPGPLMAIYYATKSFVLSFSEALSNEVHGTGVSVTVLCPGPTETEFQKHAGMANMHLLRGVFMMDARTVAEAAYSGLMKGKRVVIPGALNWIVASVVRFLPQSLVLSIVNSLHQRRGKMDAE